MTDAKHCRTEQTGVCSRSATIRNLCRDTAGNVLPLTAGIVIVLAGLVGGGVDMARAYKAERRLQAACDAGVLAGRRAVTTNGFDAAATSAANTYFNANYDVTSQGTVSTAFTPSSSDEGNTVVGTASATLPTVIMKIFNYNTIPLSVTCTASMGIGNADVMFVLDNTGSMGDKPDGTSTSTYSLTKMYALQQAMKSFYDTVAEANSSSSARIRYGFVPYSTTVRVGQLIRALDSNYISDTVTVPSINLVNWATTPSATWSVPGFTYTSASTVSNWADITNRYDTNALCNSAKPADTDWADYGSTTTSVSYSIEADTDGSLVQIKTTGLHQPQRRKLYQCSSRRVQEKTEERDKRSSSYEKRPPVPVTTGNTGFSTAVLQDRTFDVSSYKNFNSMTLPIRINRGYSPYRTQNATSTWLGCIMERQTVTAASFSFVSLATGITPSGALDLDLDSAPTSDDNTKWKVQFPQSSSQLSYVSWFRDADVPYENLDDNKDGILSDNEVGENDASTGCPQEAKQLAELSESSFDAYVDSLIATGNTYHDAGLIWGARLSSPTGLWQTLVNEEPDNGSTVSRHMIFMTDGELVTSLTGNTMYGIERNQKRVTGTGNDTDAQESRHRSRYLAVCEAIKARGIRLWIIAFGAGVTLSNDLTTCASPDSAFKSDDADDLADTFQEIAKQVGELRVTL